MLLQRWSCFFPPKVHASIGFGYFSRIFILQKHLCKTLVWLIGLSLCTKKCLRELQYNSSRLGRVIIALCEGSSVCTALIQLIVVVTLGLTRFKLSFSNTSKYITNEKVPLQTSVSAHCWFYNSPVNFAEMCVHTSKLTV